MYDPAGRLFETSGGGVVTRFLYDGDALVAEYGANGALLRRYVHGPGVDEPLVWYEGAGLGDRRGLLANHQGSIVGVTNASGGVLYRNTYEEYGARGGSDAGRFSFTGQIAIPELGLLHYKARAYNTAIGRFMQTDPVGYDDQMNLYAYVGNDPLNMSDPTGREGVGPWNNGQCNFDGCRAPRPITANDVATAVEVAGVIWDVATLPTGAGSGPEGIVAPRAIAAGIREGAEGAAARAARAACCFVAGTLIETREGLRPIEDIEVGDLVLSRNEATGETGFKPVTELVLRHERQVWRLTFAVTGSNGSSSEATFGTTDDHPWRTADGRWVRTDELQVGMEILRADGAPARVTAIVRTDEVTSTYNLEVADWHTYFVGEAKVWVHNACPITGTPQRTVQRGVETPHASDSAAIAARRAETPGAEVVTQNQTLRTATGGEIDSSLRPDVATVTRGAEGSVSSVHVDEVLSPGQTVRGQETKYSVDPRITVQCHQQGTCR